MEEQERELWVRTVHEGRRNSAPRRVGTEFRALGSGTQIGNKEQPSPSEPITVVLPRSTANPWVPATAVARGSWIGKVAAQVPAKKGRISPPELRPMVQMGVLFLIKEGGPP